MLSVWLYKLSVGMCWIEAYYKNVHCEYLLVLTCCLSLESKYIHSCKSQDWPILICWLSTESICFMIYWLQEKNWLITYIIMTDKDCEWFCTVYNSLICYCVFRKYVNTSNDNDNSLIQIFWPWVFSLYVNSSNDNHSSLIQIHMLLLCLQPVCESIKWQWLFTNSDILHLQFVCESINWQW